jgi:hypothetical protein
VHHRVSHRVVRWNLVGFIVSCISRALLYVNLCFSLTHSNLINEKRMSYCQRVNAALYEMVFKAKQTPDSSGPSSSSTEQGWFFSSRAGNNKTTQQPRSRFVAVYRQTHRLCWRVCFRQNSKNSSTAEVGSRFMIRRIFTKDSFASFGETNTENPFSSASVNSPTHTQASQASETQSPQQVPRQLAQSTAANSATPSITISHSKKFVCRTGWQIVWTCEKN